MPLVTLDSLFQEPLSGAAAIDGAGTFTAAPRLTQAASSVIDGTGALSAAARLTQSAASAFDGSGSMAATPRVTQSASAAMGGVGGMTAAGEVASSTPPPPPPPPALNFGGLGGWAFPQFPVAKVTVRGGAAIAAGASMQATPRVHAPPEPLDEMLLVLLEL